MSYFMDIVTGYWGRVKEKDQLQAESLRQSLIPRRIKFPDNKYIMVSINTKRDDLEILEYLVQHTTGKLYFSNNRIGFVDDRNAMMFTLKFG